MNEKIISVVVKLVIAIILIYLSPRIKDWFDSNTTHSEQETIKLLVDSFVQAAEQILHDEDPTGSKRMDYVKNQLTLLGIGITSEIVSIIEGSVWEVNNKNKSARGNNNGNLS